MNIKHYLLGLLSIAALASCNVKEELQPAEPARRFRAVMEQTVADAATRAYADETYHLFWNKDDRVSIFFGQTFNREFAFDGYDGDTAGGFEQVGPDPSGSAPSIQSGFNYAVYPYAADNGCNSQGTLTVVIPQRQRFYDDARGIGAQPLMVARSEKGDFIFKHVGAYIGVRLKGEGVRVASITFESNNSETLAGPTSITFDGNGDPVVAFSSGEGNSNSITMTLDTPVELDAETAKSFWLNVPAGTLAGGYTLTVTDPEGGTFQKVTNTKITLERKKFYTLDATVEITPAVLDESSYAKATTITADATYLIVNVADNLVFKGLTDGSSQSVAPVDGIITDTDGTLAAYEFTVEQSGNNYYLKFNDGTYLVSDYSSSGNSTTGLHYVNSRSAVTYPYALTTANGAFMFSTTQMSSTSSTNQVLYYKTQDNANIFKIGGSGTSIGVHLYQKGGKQDRGLQFEPGEVVCLQGSTPERPELLGIFSTLTWRSENTAVATVDGSGNVTVVGPGKTTITAEAEEDARYNAGSASYTLTILDASTAVYAKASTITVGGTYLIVDVADRLVFTGAQTNNNQSVSPENGVIIDRERTLSAYEFTVEKSGNDYYLKFSDGKYLICDYTGSGGNSTSGIRYVNSQGGITYPYALTVSNGAFFFRTSRADNGDANQYLYFKTSDNVFKIGGSGSSIGVHLYMKGGKQDRGLQFDPESVTCFLGSTPEKPELVGAYTTLTWSSDNTAVATVDGNGNVSVNGVGPATITASAVEDDDYIAGSASYTLTVLDPNGSSYTKVSSLTVGGTYLIVDVADRLVFTGAQTNNNQSVSPENGVIIDRERTLSAYEFTVEKSGNDYYLKFSDGKYLICDYTGSGGNSTSGIRYVNSQGGITYPYALTVSNGAFFFRTSRADNGDANQYLYFKTSDNVFKIGGSGASIGVHLYLKGGGSSGGDTTTKQTQTISFSASTVTWPLGQNYVIGQSYALPQTASGAQTEVNYTSETPTVATINNGRITIVAAGQATIKATAVETDTFYGATATYTLNIATPAPEGWQHLGPFDLENAALKAYLNEANDTYTDNNEQSVTCVSRIASQYSSITRQDCPAPVTITWTTPASSNTVVTIYSDQGLNTTVLSPVEAAANATSAEVYNLVPGRTYYYTVSENGSIWEKGDFSTTGRRRMLKISDTKAEGHANNCRDLGGMITKDGTKRIKYGYLFRGSNMDRTSANEKSILYNDLKIRMDIDLRSGSAGSSGWGESGNNAAFNAFANANDGNSYSGFGYLNRGFSSFDDLKGSPDRVKDVMNSVMNTVLNGEALYFHCYVGADRTGFFGLLIEGLLGISEADCSMDYELTSFSVVGLRGRDGSGQDHYWGSKNSDKGLALLRSQTGSTFEQTGSTFEQKCTNYLVSIGVSQTLINQFKNFILENNN